MGAFRTPWSSLFILLPLAGCSGLNTGKCGTSYASTWTTVDDFQYVSGKDSVAGVVAADTTSGTVYYGVEATDATGFSHELIRRSIDSGSSWKTVDDFQYNVGGSTMSRNLVVDAAGNVYFSGWGYDPVKYHGILRKGTSKGSSWSMPSATDVAGPAGDDFQYALGLSTTGVGSFVDSLGNLYFTGSGYDTGSTHFGWWIRRSTDAASTWTTLDYYYFPPALETDAYGVYSDSTGAIYAFGDYIHTTSPDLHLLIRRSPGVGQAFTNVYDYSYASVNSNTPSLSMITDPSGNLLLSGQSQDSSSKYHWLIHKGTGGGSNWAVADDYQYASGQDSSAFGIGYDAFGAIVTWGGGKDSQGKQHALLRRSTDGGKSFSLWNDYVYSPNQDSAAGGFAHDKTGNLFMSIRAHDASGIHHTVILKLACLPVAY